MWLWWWAWVALIFVLFLPVGYRRGPSRALYPSYLQRRQRAGQDNEAAGTPPDPLGLDVPTLRAGTAMHTGARQDTRRALDPHRGDWLGDLFALAVFSALVWALILLLT